MLYVTMEPKFVNRIAITASVIPRSRERCGHTTHDFGNTEFSWWSLLCCSNLESIIIQTSQK